MFLYKNTGLQSENNHEKNAKIFKDKKIKKYYNYMYQVPILFTISTKLYFLPKHLIKNSKFD